MVRNGGSVARDHLANERTFLAWLRTALGLVGLGVLLEKLEPMEGASQWAGLVLVAFGGFSLLYAVARYLRVARHLTNGTFPIAKRGPLLFSLGALAVTVFAGVYMLR